MLLDSPRNSEVYVSHGCEYLLYSLKIIVKASFQITWFPFDDQICNLKVCYCDQAFFGNPFQFGSWTYHGFAIDLQIDSDDLNSIHQMDLSDYVTNGEWNLISSPATREVTFFKCCPEPYPTIVFSMHIRRRTLFYCKALIKVVNCNLINQGLI